MVESSAIVVPFATLTSLVRGVRTGLISSVSQGSYDFHSPAYKSATCVCSTVTQGNRVPLSLLYADSAHVSRPSSPIEPVSLVRRSGRGRSRGYRSVVQDEPSKYNLGKFGLASQWGSHHTSTCATELRYLGVSAASLMSEVTNTPRSSATTITSIVINPSNRI